MKQKFWDFVDGDLDASRTTASAAVGGQALRIALDSALATKFATGLEATSNDLGAVFEATLLVYALLAADATMGIPHFQFKQPIGTNEIDFAIYDTQGRKPSDDWQAKIVDQSICAWEK